MSKECSHKYFIDNCPHCEKLLINSKELKIPKHHKTINKISFLKNCIQEDGSLFNDGIYLAWNKKNKNATLDGEFCYEALMELAVYMSQDNSTIENASKFLKTYSVNSDWDIPKESLNIIRSLLKLLCVYQ